MADYVKVVCINVGDWGDYLTVGNVYDVTDTFKFEDKGCVYVKVRDNNSKNCGHCANNFLRLPTEPKTCADMTMEEWLAMQCLINGEIVGVQLSLRASGWVDATNKTLVSKANAQLTYRVKPEKSTKDLEIERIEKEMRKLADALAKVKGG